MYIGIPPPAYISDLPPYIVPESVAIACLVAYQVASFPSGYMFAAMGLVEAATVKGRPRNTEAADMLAAGKPWLAVLTLLLDLVKGPFAIFAGIACGALFLKSTIAPDAKHHVCIPELSLYMLFLPPVAALLGHIFPLWLTFRGGKGFAAAMGIYFMLNPAAGATAAAVWLAALWLSGKPELAAVISSAGFPLWGWIFASGVWLELPDVTHHFAWMSAVLSLIVISRYRGEAALIAARMSLWKRRRRP